MPKYKLRVNGSMQTVDSSDAEKPLLYVLRGLGLTATKFGCGLGQCGACTVLVDRTAVQSCQMTVANAQGKAITTLEGLWFSVKAASDTDCVSSTTKYRNADTAQAE